MASSYKIFALQRKNLNSDDEQIHQYSQNHIPPNTIEYKNTMPCGVGKSMSWLGTGTHLVLILANNIHEIPNRIKSSCFQVLERVSAF